MLELIKVCCALISTWWIGCILWEVIHILKELRGEGMSGKYTKLRGKLPAFVEETAYQDKVNDEKSLILADAENPGEANVNWLAALFAQCRKVKDNLEEEISECNVKLEALSQLLVNALEDQSMEKITLSSGATGFIQDTPYPIVRDKEKVMAWIKKNKMTSLLGVNYQTLKGVTNERLVAGQPPPDGVEVFLKTQFRLRNGSSSEE
jgi:hypothetical protein